MPTAMYFGFLYHELVDSLEHFRNFGNGVDPKFIGIPPFPQKKAKAKML
jgi:hypothetical protein